MYTSIKGIYENGKLTLLEPAPDVEKAEVLITFLQEETPVDPTQKKRVLGGLRRLSHLADKTISIPPDFNEPLDDLKDYM
ncbi:hypothetical protein GCM10027275_29950 [Rhabdobacter roseus]|uniref:DUF2281 domain-containing protein n=1 Tax=Rhabdobacter roseus TaxID=1655419 RepID=A0A840TYI7_9BACT|nr:hypothetical protein [Rhabdobacter roseus]MBB5284950.1 hypothetical protein [Rhabdobacter roseus]